MEWPCVIRRFPAFYDKTPSAAMTVLRTGRRRAYERDRSLSPLLSYGNFRCLHDYFLAVAFFKRFKLAL
jgi:hypothetical protein